MNPTVGSLFSGIGGLDLGLERAGWEVRWQSEIAEYPSRVLKKHWPDVPNLGDVTAIDWTDVERVDLICGGYPCQPFSLAGRRRGSDDARHLWPCFRDALGALRPRFALLENVPGHLTLGFGEVLADLAALGFDAEWSLVSACSVHAPHSRHRLFVVAYPNGERLEGAELFRERLGVDSGDSNAGRWESEPDVCRVANGVPHRVDRLRALGNAVVPQVAEFIGTQLLEAISAPALSVTGT